MSRYYNEFFFEFRADDPWWKAICCYIDTGLTPPYHLIRVFDPTNEFCAQVKSKSKLYGKDLKETLLAIAERVERDIQEHESNQ